MAPEIRRRGRVRIGLQREKQLRAGLHRHHVLLQLQHHAAGIPMAPEAAQDSRNRRLKAGIQPYPPVVIHQHGRIEGKLVPLSAAPDGAVRVMDMAEELILPVRRVADRDADGAQKVEGIVQVIPPVRTLRHVRGKEDADAQPVHRILVLPVDHPGAGPAAQVAERSGPADIVVQAEQGRVEAVVAAVHIHAVAEHVGLSVRNVLPGREVGIECLCHRNSSFRNGSRSCRKRLPLYSHISFYSAGRFGCPAVRST